MVLRGCPGPEHTQCPPPRAWPLRSWVLRLGDPGLAAWPLWALASCPLTTGPRLLPLSRLPARSWEEPIQLTGQKGPSSVQPLSSRPQAEP